MIYIYFMEQGLLVTSQDFQSRDPEVDWAFHPYAVNQMSTRNFWKISGKTKTASLQWLCNFKAVELYPQKGAIKFSSLIPFKILIRIESQKMSTVKVIFWGVTRCFIGVFTSESWNHIVLPQHVEIRENYWHQE